MDEPSAEAKWRALAEKAVAAPFDTLRHTGNDGIAIEPLYRRSPVDRPRPWRDRESWAISPRVDHPDADAANRLALLDLDGGADALTIVCDRSPFSRGFGLAPDALDGALDHIELDLIGMRLDAGQDAVQAAAVLAGIAVERRLTSAGLAVDLGFDPVSLAARTGRPVDPSDIHRLLDANARGGFAGCPFVADGRAYHEAGASEAQELAAVIATGVALLRQCERAGVELPDLQIAALLALDADFFLGIAKMRAVRRLWARVEAACGFSARPMRLHAETSWRMMSRYDPWVNAMRTATAAAAAGLGGADSVTVLPMTLPLGLPEEMARRLARNVGHLLIDEANLAKVDDPAAGSGGLEALTDALCERAWTLFQDLERAGGIDAALRTGLLQGQIAGSAEQRRGDVATRRCGLVGTSLFPSLVASDIAVLATPRRLEPAPEPGTLPSRRDAEPFEALRDRAEAQTRRPTVFLATLGGPAAFGARASEAVNALAAAGIAATPPHEGADTLAARFAASGVPVACLCGTDAAYHEQGAQLIAAMRRAGAVRILMVGRDAAWLERGVDALIHDAADILDVLDATLDALLRKPV